MLSGTISLSFFLSFSFSVRVGVLIYVCATGVQVYYILIQHFDGILNSYDYLDI